MTFAGTLQIQSSATRPLAMRSAASPRVTVRAAAAVRGAWTGCPPGEFVDELLLSAAPSRAASALGERADAPVMARGYEIAS